MPILQVALGLDSVHNKNNHNFYLLLRPNRC